MESTAAKDRLCCAMALMNSTSVLKKRKQMYLYEMLIDWSKKVWINQMLKKKKKKKKRKEKKKKKWLFDLITVLSPCLHRLFTI